LEFFLVCSFLKGLGVLNVGAEKKKKKVDFKKP
jgi:hypothetical protein